MLPCNKLHFIFYYEYFAANCYTREIFAISMTGQKICQPSYKAHNDYRLTHHTKNDGSIRRDQCYRQLKHGCSFYHNIITYLHIFSFFRCYNSGRKWPNAIFRYPRLAEMISRVVAWLFPDVLLKSGLAKSAGGVLDKWFCEPEEKHGKSSCLNRKGDFSCRNRRKMELLTYYICHNVISPETTAGYKT